MGSSIRPRRRWPTPHSRAGARPSTARSTSTCAARKWPTLAGPLTGYLRFKSTAIPPNLKQIAIMLTARFWGGQYVWYSHRQQALDAGLSAAFIDAMAAGERPANMTADEAIVLDFCQQLLATRQVDDAAFKAMAERFGERGIVELVGLMGQYHTLTMLFAIDRYPLPEGARQEIDRPK